VASSFNKTPGLPVLHSKDLVTWTLISYALSELDPKDEWTSGRPGDGVWAPAIRYHKDEYVIYYPNYGYGIYKVSAKTPQGPWSKPVLVDPNPGAIDPCPFWDDDGQGWLVMGWAKSKAGFNNMITLKKLKDDGTVEVPEGPGLVIIDANTMPPVHTSIGDRKWNTLEGPKLYKRDGWYYVFAPAGSVKPGFQAVFRSKTLEGPYEVRNVLDQGDTDLNGPHQGAWVTTKSGSDWFIHFQDRDTYGRVVMLEPMKWKDGWPLIGKDHDDMGLGKPVETWKKPVKSKAPAALPKGELPRQVESFTGSMGIDWQWNGNAVPGTFSLTDRSGWLRLYSQKGSVTPFMDSGFPTVKFPAPNFAATTRISASLQGAGETAGLLILGNNSGWIALTRTAEGGLVLEMVDQTSAHNNGLPVVISSIAVPDGDLWLKVEVRQNIIIHDKPYKPPFWKAWVRDEQAIARFSYSEDGITWTEFGAPINTDKGRWVGAQVGLFALIPAETPAYEGKGKPGWADFDGLILEGR
jgi:beta-xylosidase